MHLLQILLLLWLYPKFCISQNRKNNVCKNFIDYLSMEFNGNCWYNPDVFASPQQLAQNHGFEFRNYTLETEDGYYLTIFRIQDKFSSEKKQPILLHHGLGSTATAFLSFGDQSLGFHLARNGYDVWLANHRGNNFSKGHSRLKMTDPKFWDFSFHEIAIYDIPAVLEYVTEKTGNFSKIIFVGHSMGTTIGFIYSSLKSEHAATHVKSFIAITPVTSIKHGNLFVKSFKEQLYQLTHYWLANNINVIFPSPEKLTRKYLIPFCVQNVLFCLTTLVFFAGSDEGEFIPEYLMVVLSQHPGRTSTKNLAHYNQFFFSERFEQFDYGEEENKRIYSSSKPPEYPLSNITIPVHLFYGLNDQYAGPEDVKLIFSQLTTTQKSINMIPENPKIKFNHINFIGSKHVDTYFYKPLLKILAQLQ